MSQREKIESWVLQALENNKLEDQTRQLVLDIRKVLCDYDNNWEFIA